MTTTSTAPTYGGPLAVSTRGLRKTYLRPGRGRSVAVEGLDLDVPLGGVHGFLGPNGSGKTTTIRMLLGLVRPDSGTMRLFDHEVPARLPDVIGRVGAIVEQPRFFPTFSARENLVLLAGAIGVPERTVDVVLADVGLADRARDRYRTYSLGMKQRLAVAATLLKDPDLLIFDEPTNGLDPAGIREVRGTMRALAERGKTVLVSSHILAEVEQVADTVSIIARGRLLASGRVSDLLGSRATSSVRVRLADPASAAGVLTARGWRTTADGEVLVVEGAPAPEHITQALAERGMYVSELLPVRVDLESVFLELTAGQGPGTSAWRPDGGKGRRARRGDARPVGAPTEGGAR